MTDLSSTMQRKQYNAGMAGFFLSGICAISAGILVSILLDLYHFSYGFSGTLISIMSIGSIAGAYPMGVACVGEMMSSASVGLILAFAGVGGILFPWFVGLLSDAAGIRTGMTLNLIPCAGIILIPALLTRLRGQTSRQ